MILHVVTILQCSLNCIVGVEHCQVLALVLEGDDRLSQAYDGFRNTVGLWTRMNPDRVYVQQMRLDYPLEALPDKSANTEPVNWLGIRSWGYPNIPDAQLYVSLAPVAEMADRVREDNWDDNLDDVLVEYPPVEPTFRHVFLPLIRK